MRETKELICIFGLAIFIGFLILLVRHPAELDSDGHAEERYGPGGGY